MIRGLLFLLVRRALAAVVAALSVSLFTFFGTHVLVGDPCLREGRQPHGFYENCLHVMHLDQPLWQQYLIYIGDLLQGLFGADLVARALLSLKLGSIALVLAGVIGVTAGTYSAARQQGLGGHLANTAFVVAIGVPNFVLGGFMLLFGQQVVPDLTGGLVYYSPNAFSPDLIVPALALGLGPAGFIARLTRGGVLDAIHQDYVRTATAKGLSERTIMAAHVLRNGLIPASTQLPAIALATIGGSILVESVFGLQGLGTGVVRGILLRNYEWAVLIAIYYAMLVAVANVVSDLVVAVLDPRVKMWKPQTPSGWLNSLPTSRRRSS